MNCPFCHSENIEYIPQKEWEKNYLLPNSTKGGYKCHDCGKHFTWREAIWQ